MRAMRDRTLSFAVFVLLAVLWIPGRAAAADYHLAPTGDDANAGTGSAPFRTLKKGISVLKPGDTLHVKNGTYPGVVEYGAFRSGTSWEKPVRVVAEPGHRPVIVPPADGEACLYFVDTRYFVLDGFVLDSAPNGQGVAITWGTGFPQAHHIELRNCEIKNSKGQGIGTGGDGCRFINLDVHHNGLGSPDPQLLHGIYLTGDDCLIEGGSYHDNAGHGIHVYTGKPPHPDRNVVRSVRAFGNRQGPGIGVYWGTGNRIYNNLVWSNDGGIRSNGVDSLVAHNTVYKNSRYGIYVDNRGSTIRNNIAYLNQDEDLHNDESKGANTVSHNLVGQDPKLVDAAADNFRLQRESPAIDAGVSVPQVKRDIEGTARPQGAAADVGAFEYRAAPPVRPAGRSAQPPVRARGPRRVHPDNPRYFTDGSRGTDGRLKAVYLTGSHTWNVLQDNPGSPPFDYASYLALLGEHGHNFFRLWIRMGTGGGPPAAEPTIYARTGPGLAGDGKPKYDLSRFNEAFFQCLRSRVRAAGERGVYVAVILFGGDNVEFRGGNPNWPLHPYHQDNNTNGLNGDANGDGQGLECYRLEVPELTRFQEAYVRKVIDTLGDLDNVLWEVGNELPGTLEFQNHIVRVIRQYEGRGSRKRHPVGISTFADAKPPMKELLESAADWITPDLSGGDYQHDPPSASGKKVVVSDTDHLWGVGGGPDWVWKSFTRGLNPIYMDPLTWDRRPEGGQAEMEGARRAMGQTRRLAQRIDLASMLPQGELASTRFCLANPGTEYVVYLPRGGEITVDLTGSPGELVVRWIHPTDGTEAPAEPASGGGRRAFKAPIEGAAVLYLRKR
ncbi:MAG: right-handed parallel beta-helix repeat-containing protein [Armatimonadota bacterium]